MRRKLMLHLVALLLPGLAMAQSSDSLDWKITPNLWTVGIGGTATLAGYDQDLDAVGHVLETIFQ